jgi:hypothetical protein
MTIVSGNLTLSAARGLQGPAGNATTTDITNAINALKNGVVAGGDTLAELYALILLRAELASPALTGTPTAPTASAGNNSTRIATTAYADAAVTTGIATRQPIDASLTALASPVTLPQPAEHSLTMQTPLPRGRH